jgi:hypothetical protein
MKVHAAQDKAKPDVENTLGGGQVYDRSSDYAAVVA